jgi:hypothetical protein
MRPFRFARHARVATLLLAAAPGACGDPAAPPASPPALEVRTDQTSYDDRARGAIAGPVVTVRNAGSASIYLGQCGTSGYFAGLRTEREDGGAWVDTGGPEGVCSADAAATVLELFPGDRVSVRILFPQPGRFRFRVPFGSRAATPADSVAHSNEFAIQ